MGGLSVNINDDDSVSTGDQSIKRGDLSITFCLMAFIIIYYCDANFYDSFNFTTTGVTCQHHFLANHYFNNHLRNN